MLHMSIEAFAISQELYDNNIKFENDVLLSKRTWIHRGGICRVYIEPLTVEDLICSFKICKRYNVSDIIIIGHTSNIYFHKRDYYDVIISTRKLSTYVVLEDIIKCDPGVPMKKLSAYCNNHGISGFSGFINLPGTVGAATVNNSGCFGSIISDVIVGVDYYDYDKMSISYLSKSQLEYSHRDSIFKSGKIKNAFIVQVYFQNSKGDRSKLLEEANNATQIRKLTQEPPTANLGSTFASCEYSLMFRVFQKVSRMISQFTGMPQMYILKKIVLFFYGFRYLDQYISDFNINCFIWRDVNADLKFEAYKELIGKISKTAKLEIEEK